MSTTLERGAGRVSKKEFQQRFARRAGVDPKIAIRVYDAMIDELVDLVKAGNKVTLTGFGKFYMQEHKGHTVQFKDGASGGRVDDYAVLKFSSIRAVNSRIAGVTPTAADEEDDDE